MHFYIYLYIYILDILTSISQRLMVLYELQGVKAKRGNVATATLQKTRTSFRMLKPMKMKKKGRKRGLKTKRWKRTPTLARIGRLHIT